MREKEKVESGEVRIEMDFTLKRDWIDALKGGEFSQGHGALHSIGRYCCLGVLACQAGYTPNVSYGFREFTEGGVLPSDVLDEIGIGWEEQYIFTQFNDNDRRTFLEIAEWIEDYVRAVVK